ncbi:conserved protein of unknown function [Ectopseudomonas oleovorans]|uniref:Uncharacterized protein n=1 Tax=Ectopseudomonas oleovorans TaxID=301 RepID=A0A653AZX9_ECTOL|nr:conserved protein of unknown function [Pseudomonas oleovorans]
MLEGMNLAPGVLSAHLTGQRAPVK